MAEKTQGWLVLMPEVWADHGRGTLGVTRALGSPDLGTEMKKQEDGWGLPWAGCLHAPGHFCFLSSRVRLSWPWSCRS